MLRTYGDLLINAWMKTSLGKIFVSDSENIQLYGNFIAVYVLLYCTIIKGLSRLQVLG